MEDYKLTVKVMEVLSWLSKQESLDELQNYVKCELTNLAQCFKDGNINDIDYNKFAFALGYMETLDLMQNESKNILKSAEKSNFQKRVYKILNNTSLVYKEKCKKLATFMAESCTCDLVDYYDDGIDLVPYIWDAISRDACCAIFEFAEEMPDKLDVLSNAKSANQIRLLYLATKYSVEIGNSLNTCDNWHLFVWGFIEDGLKQGVNIIPYITEDMYPEHIDAYVKYALKGYDLDEITCGKQDMQCIAKRVKAIRRRIRYNILLSKLFNVTPITPKLISTTKD